MHDLVKWLGRPASPEAYTLPGASTQSRPRAVLQRDADLTSFRPVERVDAHRFVGAAKNARELAGKTGSFLK